MKPEEVSDFLLTASNREVKKVSLSTPSGEKLHAFQGVSCYSIDTLISSLQLAKKQGKTDFVVGSHRLSFEFICFKSMTKEEVIQERIHEKELEIKRLKESLG